MVFAMRGSNRKTIYSSHSNRPLEISGSWFVSGPQPVGTEGGCPQFVADIFNQYPELKTISLGFEKSGVVFSRPENATQEPKEKV